MAGRSPRDERRRHLAQNFLRDKRLVDALASLVTVDELVVEFGAGRGALTLPLARSGARVIAVERDEVWAQQLEHRLASSGLAARVTVMVADILKFNLPRQSFRVIANPPFNLTTPLLKKLLDQPDRGPWRTDLIVQWEVAHKRSATPPATLLSTTWAPWWEFELIERIPKRSFRPVPRVDAAWLSITKRRPPVLPTAMSPEFARLVRSNWSDLAHDRRPL